MVASTLYGICHEDYTCLITTERIVPATSVTRPKQQRLLLLLLFLCFSECLYLLIVALSPLPSLRLFQTPIAAAYPWTLVPMQELLRFVGPSLTALLWRGKVSSWLLLFVICALFSLYSMLIYLLWRPIHAARMTAQSQPPLQRLYQEMLSSRWLLLLLVGVLVFGMTLLFQPRLFSDDVFTYIFSGRILVIYGADPLNTAPYQYASDPYFQWVLSGRTAPNIYGPLWLCVSSLLVSLRTAPAQTLLLFKGLALLTHLLNSILVWAILSRIAPARRFLGTLLYAWNPLAVIELSGSGHSEGLLLLTLLVTVWLLVQGSTLWHRLGVCLLFGLAISINLIAMLVAPLYIWFDLRTQQHMRRIIWGCIWRAAMTLFPAVTIFFPFWRGASTFFALTSAIDMAHFIHSPVGVFAIPLQLAFLAVADALHFPSFLHPFLSADITLRATATLIFVLIYAHLFSRVKRAPTTPVARHHSLQNDAEMHLAGYDILLSSCGIAVFWYMILVSGWFWPWYMLWILWAIVLGGVDAFAGTVLVLSGTSLLLYPFHRLVGEPIATYEPALIFGIPLLYLIVVCRRQRKRERMQATYDRRS